ncbi:zinc finger BED domain-containing protein 1-like [Centruroides sculpturatus]|uniref:zinc finger BED domain-containing protein 1-like n=1 Tax=Centruroides sculpturatus TaxID=218467 RepID=UPI000C6CFC20|nr:zinc finger BED domain-containing protein 1-like [Centruroides sculpturatus]XP_023238338.1 zinc finger BED domain-containing protein 1-like [Centruroides sculpturatus]
MPKLLQTYFTKSSKQFSCCKLCKKQVKTSGNTTNLWSHLRSNHKGILGLGLQTHSKPQVKEVIMEAEKSNEPESEVEKEIDVSSQTETNSIDLHYSTKSKSLCSSSSRNDSRLSFGQSPTPSLMLAETESIPSMFKNATDFQSGGRKDRAFNDALVNLICKENLPLSFCESEAFKKFCKIAAPLYKVPNRKKIREMIEEKYKAVSALLRLKISTVQHLSLTTDIWTDTYNNTSHMSLTCHFIDGSEFESVALGVKELQDRHTADYISEILQSMCDEWGIEKHQVMAVVTDNGANVSKAVKDLFGRDKHLRCFAHTLNLVAVKAVEETKDLHAIILEVKDIVKYFKHSVVASEKLKSIQAQNKSKKIKLKQSVPTRWNSTLEMLARFVELSHDVSAVLLSFHSAPRMISAYNLQVLREVIDILKPFDQLTKQISGEKYITVSSILPMISCMTKATAARTPMETVGKNFQVAMLNSLAHYFKDAESNYLLAISTILDPRFKRLHFNSPLACSQAISHINETLQDISRTNNEGDKHQLQDRLVQTANSDDIWSFHTCLAAKQTGTETQGDSGSLVTDLKQYLNQNLLDHKCCPLKEWEHLSAIFPNMKKLADQYYCIPGSSVPSERLFSKVGLIMTTRRNRLASSILAKLTFLSSLSEKWFITTY